MINTATTSGMAISARSVFEEDDDFFNNAEAAVVVVQLPDIPSPPYVPYVRHDESTSLQIPQVEKLPVEAHR